jgi:hypothetical protein
VDCEDNDDEEDEVDKEGVAGATEDPVAGPVVAVAEAAGATQDFDSK